MLATTAMAAFAANSVLCRMALRAELIDPASFTTLRLFAGTLCLLFIVAVRSKMRGTDWRPAKPVWKSVLALSAYMLCFSFAYQSLSTGSGALLLFGSVQLIMISTAIIRGERLSMLAWVGISVAGSGLVYLVSPGIQAPEPMYSALMLVAGLAWGAYSLFGLQGDDPTSATANNFLYATPVALLVSLIDSSNMHLTWPGGLFALASGALASGAGYAIWYAVLQHIKATTAAVMQLSVPALAALGGVLLLAEPLTLRLVLATVLTLGGIALFLRQQPRA